MKILHTSDWHLGKRLMERERLPEQIEALEEIAAVCDERGVDLVLVAGDVFDTYLPSAEAEEVFFRAMRRLAGETRAVVAVSGNHDDGVRLAASAPFAGGEGVYLFGGRNRVSPGGEGRPVRAVEAGDGYVVIANAAGERVYVNALPYPNEARLKEDKSEESYAEKTARWVSQGDAAYDGTIPHVLLTHLFVAGGRTSDSERNIDLGGARAVPLSSLPAEGYVALGHLHRRQAVGPNARYSGSLLQYSFDEANTEKSVVLLETEGKEIRVAEEIPLRAGKRLVHLEARNAEEAEGLVAQYRDCWVELTLRLDAPLTASETESLRAANPGLVSIVACVADRGTQGVVRRSELGAEELFAEYYRSQFGGDPPADLTESFLSLVGEEP